MELLAKKTEIAKLFLSFPQSAKWEEEQVAMMIAAYLETLAAFPTAVLAEGCLSFRKRSTQFPPSSGEVYGKCETIMVRRAEDDRWRNRGRLPAPSTEETAEQRAAVKARFDSLVSDLKERVATEEKRTGWRPPTKAEAEAWLEAHEGGQGVRPVTEFSPSLVEKLLEM
jgi:hypothetical protein